MGTLHAPEPHHAAATIAAVIDGLAFLCLVLDSIEPTDARQRARARASFTLQGDHP